MLDGLAQLNQDRARRDRRPGDQHPHRPVRDGVPHADVGPRADRPVPASRPHVFDLYGPDVEPARQVSPPTACCPPDGRARRAVRPALPPRLGPARQPAQPRSAASAATSTSPPAALVKDLKQRGLLDDTLVIWGGEFGRTVYGQGGLTRTNYGRDHHGRCFTIWLAGGGIKPGIVYGETDDYCYNIVKDPVHIHDLNATILHCLGIDHTRLTFRFQGRDFRLTDVHGKVVRSILA